MEEEPKPKRRKKSEDPMQEEQTVTAPRAKKPKKAAVEDEQPVAGDKWWNDGRGAKIAGLALILFSFILAVAFSSYLFTLADDQSEVANGIGSFTDGSVQVKNSLGRLGAWLAHSFINNLFGLASYLFVLVSFAVGFNLLVRKSVFPAYKVIVYSFVALVWFSATLAYANALAMPGSILSWGGAFGKYLTGTQGYLTIMLSPVGTGALLLATALVILVLIYNINFDFLLSPQDLLKKKEAAAAKAAAVAGGVTMANVPVYKDDSENIFAKDKIAELADQIENTPPFEIEEEPVEEEEMELITMDSDVEDVELEEEVVESGLQLEVEEVKEEVVAKPTETAQVFTNYDPTLDLSNYKFPPLDLLEEHGSDKVKIDPEELERNKNQIISTLNNYQIEISKIKATIGPTVTLYEIVPAPGVRISKIKNLEDDIALSLAALGIRIIAPIPGKGTIGIEVPNASKEVVSMKSLLASEKFQNTTADLPICLGKSISNEIYVADLAKMPHLLMAGATGQGKSVGLNAILVSLLYKKHPSQLKFVLVVTGHSVPQ